MFAIYLYHKEEKQKENLVRGIREQQCRVVAFYQAELAQFDIIPNILVRLPWLSVCASVSRRAFCNGRNVLYLHCPVQ